MDTNRLKQFCTIVESGSLIKASQLLFITHAGLSKSMKLLQEEIGLTLLRPSGRGIAITDDGILIYQHAKELLEQEARMLNIKKHTQTSSIKIGIPLIFQSYIGESFKRHLFNVEVIELLDLDPGILEQYVANRQIDMGVTFVPFPREEIEIIEVGKYGSSCYHLKGAFQGKHLSEIPFATPSRELQHNHTDIKERDGWIKSNYPRYKKFSVTHLPTAIELALQGLCAVYMPDFIARKVNATRKAHEILVEYPMPKNQKTMLSAFIIKHKNQAENTAFKQLHRMIKDMISGK